MSKSESILSPDSQYYNPGSITKALGDHQQRIILMEDLFVDRYRMKRLREALRRKNKLNYQCKPHLEVNQYVKDQGGLEHVLKKKLEKDLGKRDYKLLHEYITI